ncbi:MAG: 3-oxoacyl-[acyl-carrier-protein] synthase III C-terminal domain-containing protein [Acidimicrobiia bacterium]
MSVGGHYVGSFTYALGRRKWSVEESVAAGRTRTGAAGLLDAGFRFHHACDDDETAYDVAEAAARSTGVAEVGADAIVYATCIPANANLADPARFAASGDVKDLMDFPASRLQAALGLGGAVVVGLDQQACTGMLGSVRLASALLGAEPAMERVLCVGADRFPPGAAYEQAYSLISDGAGACLVSRRPAGYRLLAAHHITNGALVSAGDDETVGAYFSYTHRLVAELLAKAGVAAGELAWVVPQNTNLKAWRILSRLLSVDHERVWCPSLPDVAHVISADNVVNMAHLEASGRARPGDKVLLAMAGYGMNWQALLLEKA